MNIRQKIVLLLLLIGLLPMLAVSIIAYSSSSTALLNKTRDQLSSVATKQEQKINTILRIQQEEVAKFSNLYDLQVSLGRYVAAKNSANKAALNSILQNKKIETPAIQFAELTDLEGVPIASSNISGTSTQKTTPMPKNSGEITIAVRKDPADGFTKLYMTTLVSINKQKAAILNLVFRSDDIVAVVQDYTGLDETGETVVVAKENISLFPLRFNTEGGLQTNLGSLELYKDIRAGTYSEAIDYRGKSVLVVAHSIGLTDWIVATKVDKDEALASTVTLRNNMIVLVAAASLLIALSALFFTRIFIRPIMAVSRVAERIGLGDLTARTDIVRKDEIGLLARSVNSMGSNLKNMIGSIQSQRQRLEVIFDTTTEGLFAIDDKADIVLANRAVMDLLHVDPQTLIGKNMNDVFSWQHGMQAFTVDYTVEGVHTYADLQYTDALNVRRYVKMIVASVRGDSRVGATRAIVTLHDETSSHDLENMKTDFVSMAAHELRTPLTAVRGYLEMMQYRQEHNDPTDMESYVRQALKNVTDLGGLINNLLDVSRIERGTLTLNLEKVDLAAELTRAVEDLRFIAEDREIALTFTGAASDQYVIADSIALREIVNNLMSNAIKYTQPKGKVTVSLSLDKDQYIIAVKDTGIGIPSNAIEHLFEKFYRVHGGLDSGSSGTGLGLFIAKSIVNRLHGTISVESKEGVGSTFTFTLPVYDDAQFAKMQPKDDESSTVRRKRGWVTKNITR